MTEKELEQYISEIEGGDPAAEKAATERQAALIKPPGSLGELETISIRLAALTGKVRQHFRKPLVIIRSGLELLRNSVSLILGKRVEGDLARTVRQTILSFPEVSGVYDLILHNYGPERYIGSVHIELPGEYTVRELDILERNIAETVYEKTGVALTGIGVYAQSDGSDLSNRIFADVREAVSDMPAVLQLHGFSCDETAREIRFDVVIDYNADDRTEIFEKIAERVRRRYPDYTVLPTLDADSADF